MRAVFALGVASIVTLFLAMTFALPGVPIEAEAGEQLTWRQNEILVMRARTHACQRELGRPLSPIAERVIAGGRPYRRWVLNLWRKRASFYCKAARDLSDPVRAIYAVFGPYGSQAVRVAHCETGGTFSVYARNGQYLGLFQMGDYARATYGHSWTALGQARAAYRYFVDSGRDWSPWECKP